MCDIFAGELIICFPKVDNAASMLIGEIRENKIEHVTYVSSLEDRLKTAEIPIDGSFPYSLHLVRVPEGQEMWKANFLQFFYKVRLLEIMANGKFSKEALKLFGTSNQHFLVVPNSTLSLNSPAAGKKVSAVDFKFSTFHKSYRSLLGFDQHGPSAEIGQIKIMILDSGAASDISFKVYRKNLVNPAQSQAVDDNGHGTAVAMILNDLIPGAEFHAYKVVDSNGRATEWDVLAALACGVRADVYNLSLQFGLDAQDCPVCGRRANASRSAVFENVIMHVSERPHRPLIVAASGNSNRPQLSFPARFGNVLAIESIATTRQLSSFSNYGDRDAAGDPHQHVYVVPGGEGGPSNAAPKEFVGSYATSGEKFYGTSFSAAYASGMAATVLSHLKPADRRFEKVMDNLKNSADTHLPSFDPKRHGNGMMRLI